MEAGSERTADPVERIYVFQISEEEAEVEFLEVENQLPISVQYKLLFKQQLTINDNKNNYNKW